MNDASKLEDLAARFERGEVLAGIGFAKDIRKYIAATAEPSSEIQKECIQCEAIAEPVVHYCKGCDISAGPKPHPAYDATYVAIPEQATSVEFPLDDERVHRELWVYGNIALPTREAFKALGIAEAYGSAILMREV